MLKLFIFILCPYFLFGDFLDPKKYGIGERLVSELSFAPNPWIHGLPGKTLHHTISSTSLMNQRPIRVYLPPGYTTTHTYPLCIFFDGDAYTSTIPTPTILDNMIAANAIPPVVAVFIDNPTSESRAVELPCNPHFANFVARELVPWLQEHYSLSQDPQNTLLAGSSYGGLAAAYIALSYPDIFGKVLCQSGAFWWKPDHVSEYEWLTTQYSLSPKLALEFYLEVGKHETIEWYGHPSVLFSNQNLRDVLLKKRYTLTYSEFNGGHDYNSWRSTLPNGLQALLKNQ